MQEKTFNTNVGKVGCHTVNIGELLIEMDIAFASEEDKIKIPIEDLPKFIGLVWGKLKETFLECEGKEVVIDFGDSASANAIEGLLKLLLDFLPDGNGQKTPKSTA